MVERVYPEHLYEEIRREIGVNYVRHELRKYLPSVQGEAWRMIDGDVATWFEDAPFLAPVRDFWNGVHGIMMGFKLYNQLLSFVTAENISWEKREIELAELTFGSVNPVLASQMEGNKEVTKAQEICNKNEDFREEGLKELEAWYSVTESREEHPIIVTEKDVDGKRRLVIYDGNGRATMAVLKGREKILAFIGKFTDEGSRPKNFWLPTSLLMDVTAFTKLAWKEKREEVYEAHVRVIKDMLEWSESGRYEMKERVISDGEFRQKFLGDLGLLD